MLDYRVFANHFNIKHFEQAPSYFVPGGHCADVIQHRRPFTECHSLLYTLYEINAPKVHEVLVFSQGRCLMNAGWSPLVIALELTSSEEKGQMLVVIQSPNSVRTGRLQHVSQLYLPYEHHVLLEYTVDGADQVVLSESTNLAHAENEHHKIEFMTSTIVNSFVRAERFL